MRKLGVVFFVVYSLSTFAQGGGNEPNGFPVKMKTGRNTQKTRAEIFREVMGQIQNLREDTIVALGQRRFQAEIQAVLRIIPQWCQLIPAPLLIHVGFDRDDTDWDRALKFLRLGLFVRDMYLDFDINRNQFLTFQIPIANRLSDQIRFRIVANAFSEAFTLLYNHKEVLSEDEVATMADLGTWALHYLQKSGDAQQTVQVAGGLFDFARKSLGSQNLGVLSTLHMSNLLKTSMQVTVESIAPLVLAYLAMVHRNQASKI